jgi:hypothetical protein
LGKIVRAGAGAGIFDKLEPGPELEPDKNATLILMIWYRVESLLTKRIDEDDELQKDFSHSRQHRFRSARHSCHL